MNNLWIVSPRELEVLQLVAEGNTLRQIADHLLVEVCTIKHHTRNLTGKLQANNLAHAVGIGLRRGLIQ